MRTGICSDGRSDCSGSTLVANLTAEKETPECDFASQLTSKSHERKQASGNTKIVRKPLLAASLNRRQVTAVDVREITFKPNQRTGRHKHPCPVIGYIAEGEAILQIEGQPSQQLSAGSAFYEPADVVISRFDNSSGTSPMKFIAHYLLNGDQELIEML